MRLLTILLLLSLAAPAQVYVDANGYLRYNKPKPDTVTIVKEVPVIVRDTVTIYNCPPTQAQHIVFNVQQRDFRNVAIPGGKLETWSEQWVANPGYGKQDGYFRFSWSMLEGAQGQYTFDVFKRQAELVFARGGRFSFGIMTHYPDAVAPHRLNYDGGYSVYPQYLHNLMQAEPVKDWKASNGAWVPNWNSDAYITRLEALHKALDAYIKAQGWQDRIAYVDIRGYGAFGEWHSYTIADNMNQYPTGTRATEASLRRIVDAHINGFPDFPLVAMVSAFDADRLGNTMNPPGIAAYILKASNRWGKLGWRRDNWGATDDYIRQYTSGNTKVVDGMRLDTAIMNRWRYAPVVGEPCCSNNYTSLVSQLTQAHATSLGNGNYSSSSSVNAIMVAAGEAIGSRITIKSGEIKDGQCVIVWDNKGNVPLYESFNVRLSVGTWSKEIAMPWLLPGETKHIFEVGEVPSGELHITVRNNFRQYPLGITSSKVAEVK